MGFSLAYERRYRAARRRNGMCISCVREADAGVMCKGCLGKKRERNRRWRLRVMRAGLCVECAKEPRTPHRTLGERCAARKVDYYAKRRSAA